MTGARAWLRRLAAGWTRLELAACLATVAALVLSLLAWVVLKGLSARTTDAFVAGVVVRGLLLGTAGGALAWRLTGRAAAGWGSALLGAALAWPVRDVGVGFCGNLLAWLQDASLLTWFGGLRGLGTRLTLLLALLGASLATAGGRHVTIDLATRGVPATWRPWLLRLSGAVACLVCAVSAWGFFDYSAVDAFQAPAAASPGAKAALVLDGLERHLGRAVRQARLDLTVLPRVLRGQPWGRSLTGAEWNQALEGDEALASQREPEPAAFRVPLLSTPEEASRGLFVHDLGLMVPLGLALMALRFALWLATGAGEESTPGSPPGVAGSPPRASGLTLAGVGAAASAAWAAGGWSAALVAVLALGGVPLFAVMGGGAALAWTLEGAPLNRLAPRVLDEQFAGSPVLVTIPLFTLLGYVLAESRAPTRIVEASRALFGWLPGGLALVCLLASAFFTTLTGGSGVTIVAIGGLLYPALRSQGYDERFSLGLVTTGGSLGLLLPPSLPILVYSLVAGLDFQATFKAGLLPGLLVLAALGAYAAWVGLRDRVPREPFRARAALQALGLVKWELGIPVVILGGLGTSLTTLDESAALALAYALAVALAVKRDLTWRQLPAVAGSALALAGAIILILMMANALMNVVIDRQVPARVLEALVALGLSERWQFLVVLNLFLLVVGMLMDGFSALLVAVPLVLPFAARFGLHPFHLAMMVLLNLELAFCAPPLGLNLFIASFRFRRPVASLYRSVLPFVALLSGCLAVVMAAPVLSTALVQGDIDARRAEAERLGLPPREAWVLECVQEDSLHPHPCSAAEQQRYRVPDAGLDEGDEALLREMLGQ